MNGFIIRQAGEIEVNGPDGIERINGLLLEGDVSHIRLAAVWFGERVSVAPIASPSPSQVAPQPQAGEPVATPEGCSGEMTPARVVYFLERFKNDEKMLGPHEQWALDVAIAAFRASPQPANPAQVTDAMVKAAEQIIRKAAR